MTMPHATTTPHLETAMPAIQVFLTELETTVSRDPDLRLSFLYQTLAQKYDYPIAFGSSRAAIVFESHSLVLKLPVTRYGAIQNSNEYAVRHQPDNTDVLARLPLFGKPNYINLVPYYQPILTRFNSVIATLEPKALWTIEALINAYDESDPSIATVDDQMMDVIMTAFTKMLLINDVVYDLTVREAIPHLNEDLLMSYILKTRSDDNWFDPNPTNFGFDASDNLIMLDAGLINPGSPEAVPDTYEHLTGLDLKNLESH